MGASVQQFDLAVIGSGPGGYVAAIRAAQLGASVALVEMRELGGTCLNRGCIPSKALLASADALNGIRAAAAFGIRAGEPELAYEQVMQRKDRIVHQLQRGIEYLLKKNDITHFAGHGRLLGRREIEVQAADGSTSGLRAEGIVLATGSEPLRLPVPGVEGERVITSDEALFLPEPPESIIIIGAGPVGVEFAYIYASFGAQVHLLEMLPRVLPAEEPEVSEVLTKRLQKLGVKIVTEAKAVKMEGEEGPKGVLYERGGELHQIAAQYVLLAVGRQAAVRELGTAEAGVVVEGGRIVADEGLRTPADGIYAIGDCLRGVGLAHLAAHEGITAAENALGSDTRINYAVIPNCIYTSPEVASVGLKEQEARERGHEVAVGIFPFRVSGKALCLNEREGLCKVIVDKPTGKLLGCHLVGPEASSVIAAAGMALHAGLTAEQLRAVVVAHPSLPEVFPEAALAAMGMGIHI